MKIPNWKELKINIKEILWNNDFKTFEDFKNAYSGAFCAKLGHYLNKVGQHTKNNFSFIYNVVFYYGYINQKREKDLLNLLAKNDYSVKVSSMLMDAVIGVDLIAAKNNKTYVIQVKPNNKFTNFKHIKTYANNKNYEVVFAYKNQQKWIFIDKNKQNIVLF